MRAITPVAEGQACRRSRRGYAGLAARANALQNLPDPCEHADGIVLVDLVTATEDDLSRSRAALAATRLLRCPERASIREWYHGEARAW